MDNVETSSSENQFNLIRNDRYVYLQSPLLASVGTVQHAFSTRIGGCSSGNYTSLNMAFHNGDQVENVLENRRRYFKQFEFDYRCLVSGIQVHGAEIAEFGRENSGEGATPGTAKKNCDALVTSEPGICLTAYAADCMLIYYSALDQAVVALAHAGWRGTLDRIGSKVVRYLVDQYNVDPEQLLVALSPAICSKCYQVDQTVAGQFISAGWDDPTCIKKAKRDFCYLDLSMINASDILKTGVKKENLALNYWCTACNDHLFYSYRRDKGKTGRMIGFISINRNQGD